MRKSMVYSLVSHSKLCPSMIVQQEDAYTIIFSDFAL